MKFVRNLEDLIEKYVEGFFNKKFSSGLQPVEIAKALVRAMEGSRSVGVSQIYVPNHYLIYINKGDYERLVAYGQAIRDELAQYVSEEARKRNFVIVGQPMIDLNIDETLELGKFRATSMFTEPLPSEDSQDPRQEEPPVAGMSDTRVFAKTHMGYVENAEKRRAHVDGLLTVIDGLDEGVTLEIGMNRVNMGRRESNEMPLTDMNTSRLHAYVTYEECGHILHDAKSLNGTYVNGHRITRKKLRSGDRIKIGNTVILYEVN